MRFRVRRTSTSWFTGSVTLFDRMWVKLATKQPISSSAAAMTTLAKTTTFPICDPVEPKIFSREATEAESGRVKGWGYLSASGLSVASAAELLGKCLIFTRIPKSWSSAGEGGPSRRRHLPCSCRAEGGSGGSAILSASFVRHPSPDSVSNDENGILQCQRALRADELNAHDRREFLQAVHAVGRVLCLFFFVSRPDPTPVRALTPKQPNDS